MSNNTNTILLERAADMIDYWDNTVQSKILEQLVEANDLEALVVEVAKAEAMASQQEFQNNDCA